MNSKKVDSSQQGIHPNLQKIVQKHRTTTFMRPIAEHTQRAFDSISERLLNSTMPLYIDTGCGTGESTIHLAQQNTHALCIGIDRSEHRLAKAQELPSNAVLLRADVSDFISLCAVHSLRIERLYFLYPNPSPKSEHLMRRWHAHPIFPTALSISNSVELRTNWAIYAQEFAVVLQIYDIAAQVEEYSPDTPITPFERKYKQSGHNLYRVVADIPTTMQR